MAQFSTEKNRLLGNNNALYEVVMIAGQSGPSVFIPKGNLNASTDAFGRLRVSEPHTVFDNSFRYPGGENRWTNKTTGTTTIVLVQVGSILIYLSHKSFGLILSGWAQDR